MRMYPYVYIGSGLLAVTQTTIWTTIYCTKNFAKNQDLPGQLCDTFFHIFVKLSPNARGLPGQEKAREWKTLITY